MIPKENYGSGNTPLIITCYDGYTDIVQWLLHNNVNVDQCRNDMVTGLIMASQEGHTDINGFTPLINACDGSYTSIVQLLMKHKPNIDAQTYGGCNALIFSAANGNLEITQLLVKSNADYKGADTQICRLDGKSPLQIATDNGHASIVVVVSEHMMLDTLSSDSCSVVIGPYDMLKTCKG
ncbi:unnamed protein product [Mytilus edulis]|uniref:Uncharacterized protein n=1 Tax=Mytilus edulis TaxID=6550 RepID=A0A8S3QZ64_MYTED|nr:unnamed protein product [Mytilus edulis]